MKGMHAKGFIHGDIKPQNFLRDGDSSVLADFGFYAKVGTRNECRGTPIYVAPEIYNSSIPNDTPVDVFSFGMLLYILAHPDEAIDFAEKRNKVRTNMVAHRACLEGLQRRLRRSSNELDRLIADCLNFDPGPRPKTPELESRFLEYLQTMPGDKK